MSHYIINIFLDFFKFRVIFSVKQLPPACSHANSNMSSQQNFRNPTHGSEVVNATEVIFNLVYILIRFFQRRPNYFSLTAQFLKLRRTALHCCIFPKLRVAKVAG
jgi:hypothetical protein